MKKSWIGPLGVFVIVLAVLAGLRFWFGGAAPTPEAFEAHTTLTAALAQSETTGRPVLALATADWCGPCQSLKRGALADAGVAAWIRDNAVPAYVDCTDSGSQDTRDAGRLLGVRAYPTLVLLRDGEIAAQLEGNASAGQLLDWLQREGGG